MPAVSTAEFCAHCLRPSSELTPHRPHGWPEKYATPKFCRSCVPTRRSKEGQVLLTDRRERTDETFRALEEEARVRPLLKLMRKTCPAYAPAPMFTPRVSNDAVSEMERDHAMSRRRGWRFVNGMYERIEW